MDGDLDEFIEGYLKNRSLNHKEWEMTRLHGLSFRFLFVLAFLGFLAAAYISYERYKVESNDQTVEMVYDYDKLEGRAKEDLLRCTGRAGSRRWHCMMIRPAKSWIAAMP